MADNRDNEARSWNDAEADGDRAVEEMRRSLDRLRGQVGAYRSQVADNDDSGNGDEGPQA
jgi:hypothetical protein